MAMITEYVVYETATATYNPIEGLKVGHVEAYYHDYEQMERDWLKEFLAGTHNFFIYQVQA